MGDSVVQKRIDCWQRWQDHSQESLNETFNFQLSLNKLALCHFVDVRQNTDQLRSRGERAVRVHHDDIANVTPAGSELQELVLFNNYYSYLWMKSSCKFNTSFPKVNLTILWTLKQMFQHTLLAEQTQPDSDILCILHAIVNVNLQSLWKKILYLFIAEPHIPTSVNRESLCFKFRVKSSVQMHSHLFMWLYKDSAKSKMWTHSIHSHLLLMDTIESPVNLSGAVRLRGKPRESRDPQ